jgi:hypothetical protein
VAQARLIESPEAGVGLLQTSDKGKLSNIMKSTIKNNRRYAAYLTVALGLIVVFIFAFIGNSGCRSAQIKSKKQVLDKYLYQLSDGSQTWSNQDFSVNESICVSYPDSTRAQK